ncbi:hypothetical protein [Candidatus Electronema sp. PJ]|uniref:hypothetical protein n=1 Tax=Candidatus Electronema sp. PJ TaxID=3401572 RepID=UPI003AA93158
MYVILVIVLEIVAFLGKMVKFIIFGRILFLTGIFSIGLHVFNHFQDVLPSQFTRLFSMFFVGVAFFVWRDKIFLSSISKDSFFIAYCLLLPYLVFYVAYIPSGQVRKFNKYGDYSYGMYIYAFPVQQSLAQILSNISFSIMFSVSFLITLLFAIASWHLIEKRFLRMKEGYIVIENFVQNILAKKL